MCKKIFFITLLTSCTTIGFHNSEKLKSMDFGNQRDLKLCLYHDPEISHERIQSLVSDLSEELKIYKIGLKVTQKKIYNRKYFFTEDSLNLLLKEILLKDCDRILALFPRNFWDFLLAIPFPEILGVVETYTRTRGIVYADYFTPNLLVGATPNKTFVHETYHLLGCDHALWMDECYDRIQYAKKIPGYEEFFPSFGTETTIIYTSREEVNRALIKN